MQEVLNEYAKNILKAIAMDYKDELGQNNTTFLYSLLQRDFIILENNGTRAIENDYLKSITPEKSILEDGNIHINLTSYKHLNREEKLITIKEDIIHHIFHYFINPEKENESDNNLKEFYSFLTEGFVEKYANEFCEKHGITRTIKKKYLANINFVSNMLNVLPEEISKEKTIFQYQYSYILELCQLGREYTKSYGVNYYSQFEKHYLKEKDFINIINFILDTHPDKRNLSVLIPSFLDKYKEIGKIEYARNDLKETYKNIYKNNPLKLETIEQEIDKVFNGEYVGQSQIKGTTRVLAPAGFFEGSILIVLCISLGVILSLLLLQS